MLRERLSEQQYSTIVPEGLPSTAMASKGAAIMGMHSRNKHTCARVTVPVSRGNSKHGDLGDDTHRAED